MGNVNGREEGESVIVDPRRSDVDSGFSENSDRRTRVPSLDSMGNTPPESPGRSRSPLLFAPQPRKKTKPAARIWLNPDGFNNQEPEAALVVSSSSPSSSEGGGRVAATDAPGFCRPAIPFADLEAKLFGELALPASVATMAASAEVVTPGPAAIEVDAPCPAAVEVLRITPAAADETTPTPVSSSARTRERPAEVLAEEIRAWKRARTEEMPRSDPQVGPSPSAEGIEQAPTPARWRPDFEVLPGRPVTKDDRISRDDNVIFALGRACSLPRDMERHRKLDHLALCGSTMRSALAIVQNCQVGMERLYDFNAHFSKLEEERDKLKEAVNDRDASLAEVVGRQIPLAEELNATKAEAERLKEENEVRERRITKLEASLERQRAELQEALAKQRTEADAALAKQMAESEVALEKIRAESKAELQSQRAEFASVLKAKTDKAYLEGGKEATKKYRVQVFKVSEKVWRLGCLAALSEAGVSSDHPVYMNPPRFPRSDPGASSARIVPRSDLGASSAPVAPVKPSIEAQVESVEPTTEVPHAQIDLNAEAPA